MTSVRYISVILDRPGIHDIRDGQTDSIRWQYPPVSRRITRVKSVPTDRINKVNMAFTTANTPKHRDESNKQLCKCLLGK